MIKSNVNNPRLRFPNFKDDWKKFQLKDVPKFNTDNSNFLRHVKKLNLFYTESGFLREGRYPNIVEYPIIAVQTEIRNFEKLYASIAEESLKLKIK